MVRCFSLLCMVWLAVCRVISPATAQSPARSEGHPAVGSRFLMAHYMPWFEADSLHGRWGWHWTMNHYHPEQCADQKREAASHYYPLLGLYDSNDTQVLECQVLMMKFAGIDGVIIDWYGTDDFRDYGLIHRNTQHLIEIVKKAGLRFFLCYEDQSVANLLAAKRFAPNEALAHGKSVLRWVQTHWFSESAYHKEDNHPIFLVFGNGYYQTEAWRELFAGLPQSPDLFTEASLRPPAVGAFDWPQPKNGTEQSFREMDAFYTRAKQWPHFIPAAFPRFHDIYQEAGVQKSWGKIEDRNGKTYAQTLERALQSSASLIQLVTWNDWGEGTQIEPSREFGYRDLETTQQLRRKYLEPAFPYTAQDLRLPLALYALKHADSKQATHERLEEVSRLLFAGDVNKARGLIAELSKQFAQGVR